MEINKTILVIDDEAENREILGFVLEPQYRMIQASSGAEALELAHKEVPGVILLDIRMPGMQGYEVAVELRKLENTKRSKIILISAQSMLEDRLRGYQSGADDFISKPFHADELVVKVNLFMELFSLENELKEQVKTRSEQLLKTERLVFVGLHSGEIIHNLKNPLATIKHYSSALQAEMPQRKEVERICTAVDRILEMVKNILLSIKQDIHDDIQTVNLNQILLDELDFLKLDSILKYEIETELHLDSQSSISLVPNHLRQVVGNLIKNAVEAMYQSPQKKLYLTSLDRDQRVFVSIRDTGGGIAPEHLNKIFTPLFSTKDGKQGEVVGNGLGLPYCKKIIETYGGTIRLTSVFGEGVTVEFDLPSAKQGSTS